MSNSYFFFHATDSSGNVGLWESDGTTVGTFEIGGLSSVGISGADATFDPFWIYSFNEGVLVRATDTNAFGGLWFSDGTAGGTYEIGGLQDAGVAGSDQTPF